MDKFIDLIKGGNLRSIGNSDKVAALVVNNPEMFDDLFACIFHENEIIHARAADAVEKVARRHSYLIQQKKT